MKIIVKFIGKGRPKTIHVEKPEKCAGSFLPLGWSVPIDLEVTRIAVFHNLREVIIYVRKAHS